MTTKEQQAVASVMLLLAPVLPTPVEDAVREALGLAYKLGACDALADTHAAMKEAK